MRHGERQTDPAVPAVAREESLGALLRLLGPALVARARSRMPMRVVRAGVTACGLVLMCLPLLLWVAWSRPVLYGALAAGALAGLVLSVLIWLCPEDRI